MIETPTRERTKPKTAERVETARPVDKAPAGAYARLLLELPAALVLTALWSAGVVLLGLCALALYLVGTALA
jgi:hypothetical protein